MKHNCRTKHYACGCVLKRMAQLEIVATAVEKLIVQCNHKPEGWDDLDKAFKALQDKEI